MIIFWILIIGLAIWFITSQMRHNRNDAVMKALDIARERYAKGEITREEFDQIKKIL